MKNRKIWNIRYLKNQVARRNILFRNMIRYLWNIIYLHAEDDIKEECIDVGCGNLSFWRYNLFFYRQCKKYVGIDISDIIINKNKIRFRKHKNKTFIRVSSSEFIKDLSSKVVLCMDVLFHIVDDEEVYIKTLINLCKYSKKWIILTNWYREPINYKVSFQKYRDFKSYQYIFIESGFELISRYIIPVNNTGLIYVYKKVD